MSWVFGKRLELDERDWCGTPMMQSWYFSKKEEDQRTYTPTHSQSTNPVPPHDSVNKTMTPNLRRPPVLWAKVKLLYKVNLW